MGTIEEFLSNGGSLELVLGWNLNNISKVLFG